MKSSNFSAITFAPMLRVGKIVATHGLAGDVVFTHIAGRKSWLKPGDVLFLALQKGSFIPYFIKGVRSEKLDEMNLSLEDCITVEAARRLVGKEVFVKDEVLQTAAIESPLLWLGFEAIDQHLGSLGPIQDVYKTAQQWLATVVVNGKEALLPLIDQTLRKVDVKAKRLYLDLPPGLLEVYLD